MRKLIVAAGLAAAAALIPASGASAQYYGGYGNGYYGNSYNRGHYGQNNRVRQEVRECRRELRRADNRWEYQRELRECRREIARARYQSRYRGYGDRYYRSGYRDRW